MKKKLRVSALLMAAVLAFSLAVSASAAEYSGVSDWAEEYVAALDRSGAVPQKLLSDFTAPITRAEFTSIIVLAYEKITGSAAAIAAPGFTDIADSDYALYISKAYSLGIINGISTTSFAPDASIKRQEAAKILYTFSQAIGIAGQLNEVELDYSDVEKIDGWAKPYVCYCYENGLMNGSNGSFLPYDSLTREQAMTIIRRLWASTGLAEIPEPPQPKDGSVYRALAVGVSDYKDTANDGERFANSVSDFVSVFSSLNVGGRKYAASSTMNVLSDGLYSAISAAFSQADEDDVSVFLLSGHGIGAGKSFDSQRFGSCVFALSDGENNEYVDYADLVAAFKAIKGTKVLLVGNCYSGGLVSMAADDSSIIIITACAQDEESHGLISGDETYNVFEQGVKTAFLPSGSTVFAADQNLDGAVTFTELAEYLKYACQHTVKGAESTVQVKAGSEVTLATKY